MPRSPHRRNGYTLIELLVVLVIVGILAGVAVTMLGNRRSSSVRTLMDQVEGSIMQAQASAMASGQDVTIAVNGTWTSTGKPSLESAGAFCLDPRPFQVPSPPPDPYTAARLGSDSERFISLYAQHDRDHMHAGVSTDGQGQALVASLGSLPPFNSATDTSFSAALRNLICGGGGQNKATVNGVTYRFTTGFSIVIVSLNGDGSVDTGGAVGVLVVPQNTANVFRFYRPAGGTTWQRI